MDMATIFQNDDKATGEKGSGHKEGVQANENGLEETFYCITQENMASRKIEKSVCKNFHFTKNSINEIKIQERDNYVYPKVR